MTVKGEKTFLNDEQAREFFFKWVDIHRKARKGKSEKEIIEEQEETEPDEIQAINKTDLLQVLQSLTPTGFEKNLSKVVTGIRV